MQDCPEMATPDAYFLPPSNQHYFLNSPASKEITNNTRKIKNRILAIDTAPAAMPPNPNTAAMMAIIKKINAQRNIVVAFKVNNVICSI
jgi:hypothetical protein